VDTFENMREIYENSPFNKYLGLKLEKFEEGAVVYSLKITPSHLNVNQGVHGGVFFSMLDSVTGATIRSVTIQPIVTVNMSIHYFAPAKNEETLTASAKIIQQGNSIVTAEGIIEDSGGEVLAKSVGTFKIIHPNRSKS
jgi:uncharacterized protein (TIGR00369 family)